MSTTHASSPRPNPKDVTVEVADVRLEHPTWRDIVDRSRVSDLTCLLVVLHVTNNTQTRKVDYQPWQMHGNGVSMRDELGNRYTLFDLGLKSQLIFEDPESHERLLQSEWAAIHPQRVLTDAVVFEKPIEAAKKLTLTLPLENLDERGTVSLEIDTKRIH
jgi:hypothetical protein